MQAPECVAFYRAGSNGHANIVFSVIAFNTDTFIVERLTRYRMLFARNAEGWLEGDWDRPQTRCVVDVTGGRLSLSETLGEESLESVSNALL